MKIHIGHIVLVIALLTAPKVNAQQEQHWEDCYAEVIAIEGKDEEDIPDYELLCQLADHPININTATKEDLEQLPFLNNQQIEDIMEYLYRYHSLQSVGELYMIPSLGNAYARLLSYFITIGKPNETDFPGKTCCITADIKLLQPSIFQPISGGDLAKESILAGLSNIGCATLSTMPISLR